MLPTTRKVKLHGKKKFVVAAFDLNYKVFVVYIAIFNICLDSSAEIRPLKRAQIAYIKVDMTSIKVASKDADFADIFLLKLVV